MGEVARFSGAGTGLISREDMARGLNNVSMVAPRVGGEYQYLKLSRAGEWLYGQDDTEVIEGSRWAVNPQSLEYGYIAWPDPDKGVAADPEGEVMVPITRPLPAIDTLRTRHPDGRTTGKNGWQYQQSVVLVCIDGEDEGTVCQYKASSVGSQKLFSKLINDISTQIAKGSDAIVPIITMKTDSYKHKSYGKIYNPLWEVLEFLTMGAPAETEAPAEETKPEPEPVRTRTRSREEGTVTRAQVAAVTPNAEEPDDEENAALAREYEAAQAEANPVPRRRVRR